MKMILMYMASLESLGIICKALKIETVDDEETKANRNKLRNRGSTSRSGAAAAVAAAATSKKNKKRT
jgi:hypothetical protein